MRRLKLVPGPPHWYMEEIVIIKNAFEALEEVVIDDTTAMLLWQRYSDSLSVGWVAIVVDVFGDAPRMSDAEIVAALANYYEVTDGV